MKVNDLGANLTSKTGVKNMRGFIRVNMEKQFPVAAKFNYTNLRVASVNFCAAETRAETSKTKQLLRVTKTKRLRALEGIVL